MDRYNQIIIDMQRVMEAIDTFKYHKTPDAIIIKRIYNLAKFECQEAQKRIDMKLDAMEREFKDAGTN